MSTTIERRNGTFILTDGDVETTITTITKDGLSLILPDNSSGRKFFALSKFEKTEKHDLVKINRELNDEPTPRKLSEFKFPKSHLKIHEQLNDEELGILCGFENSIQIYMEMMESALDRLYPKKESLTEEQKLRNKIAKLQAQLEAAMKNEEAQA